MNAIAGVLLVFLVIAIFAPEFAGSTARHYYDALRRGWNK